mmetsp:Transcript_42420/g.123262  ORF Transcript_42420/g.123262 Transcript_42420/m.123262 type:complete len:311 (+) Transcript_42420:95-1027(+)
MAGVSADSTPSSCSSPASSPAGETLHKYADLLRVGQLSVNGREVSWDTKAATSEQLDGFRSAFVGELKRLAVTSSLEDDVLEHSAHLVCKALSINYVLSELLSVLRRKLRGKYTDIYRISDNSGSTKDRPEYGVEVVPGTSGQVVRAFVRWRSKGNIVCCDARTAKMKVKGTLYAVETSFPLAPDPGYQPVYSVKVETKTSRFSRLSGAMKNLCSNGAGPRRPTLDKLHPEEPFSFQSETSNTRYGAGDAGNDDVTGSEETDESGEPEEHMINIRSAWDSHRDDVQEIDLHVQDEGNRRIELPKRLSDRE